MSRLQKTLEDLHQKGYKFSSLKQLRGGINSAVFQAKSSDAVKYALKLYTLPSINDPRNRCKTEKDFLNHLNNCSVRNTPTLLESNTNSGWCLMSWIDGQKPTNLGQADLEDITDFISLINQASTEATRSQLEPASEACQSLEEMVTSISERLKRLQSSNPSSETNRKAIQWITKTLEPQFQASSMKLLNTRKSCKHWKDLHVSKIASPSDVGIHNTLRNQQGLHYLDFEYAGYDDLSKLAADWVLQPEYRFNKTQEESFCKLLLTKTKSQIGISWRARLNDIKPLIHIKWCLIMLKNMQTNNLTERQLLRTISYFNQQP